MAKYLAVIENNDNSSETSQPVNTLAEAWQWFVSQFPQFTMFFENANQFKYWYGRKRTIGMAGNFVKAGVCRNRETGYEVFTFRVERELT